MPTYDYHCPENDRVVEVLVGFDETVETWGQLCKLAEIPGGDTSEETPVYRLLGAPGLAFPKSSTEQKNLGFTKLVRRDKGVYENVTATDGESKLMKADDPSTMPNLSKKISD